MIFEIENYASLREATEKISKSLSERSISQERVFDIRLVINELVGNVLRHAKTSARLGVVIESGFVELCVYSEAAFVPPTVSRKVEVFAESGRGLFLVDSVSEERIYTGDGCIRVRVNIKN